jgi:hypothetical protein
MAMCFIGALAALLLFTRVHDAAIERLRLLMETSAA